MYTWQHLKFLCFLTYVLDANKRSQGTILQNARLIKHGYHEEDNKTEEERNGKEEKGKQEEGK